MPGQVVGSGLSHPSADTPFVPSPQRSSQATVLEERRSSDWRERLAGRVRSEFVEMPGMALSPRQAQRLFGLRADICERILDRLVATGFLERRSTGLYARPPVDH